MKIRKTREIEALRQLPRLAGLSDREIGTLAEAATRVHLPAHWSLIAETTPADKAYVIVAGEVAIRQRGETVGTAGAGEVIGEVGIMERRLRSASVVSLTELDVLHFTNADLDRLGREVPAFGELLHAAAREHLEVDKERSTPADPLAHPIGGSSPGSVG